MWETEVPEFADMSLLDVLEIGETEKDQQEPKVFVGIWQMPPGFEPLLRVCARRYKRTYPQVIRLSMKHGVSILKADTKLLTLERILDLLEEQSIQSPLQSSAMSMLSRRTSFYFPMSVQHKTTLSCIWWVKEELSSISHTTGVAIGNLAIIACLASTVTIPDKAESGYQVWVRQVMDMFFTHVQLRQGLLAGVNGMSIKV